MTKTNLTKLLENQIARTTQENRKGFVFGVNEVTIGLKGKERVDYMTCSTEGIFRCYEIKISKADQMMTADAQTESIVVIIAIKIIKIVIDTGSCLLIENERWRGGHNEIYSCIQRWSLIS